VTSSSVPERGASAARNPSICRAEIVSGAISTITFLGTAGGGIPAAISRRTRAGIRRARFPIGDDVDSPQPAHAADIPYREMAPADPGQPPAEPASDRASPRGQVAAPDLGQGGARARDRQRMGHVRRGASPTPTPRTRDA
jgi:hypothetical protein